mgnify:CR=1 FL=1
MTTKGFRDTIEMRTESRFEQYDLNLELPKPLIERKDRYVLSERISANGSVLLPFDVTEAKNLIDLLSSEENGYKAVKYEKIVPLLIECIKEQQTQIEDLRNEVESLKNKF